MSDDLVKRLRVCAAFDPDQAEAADRIEKDAQHIDKMYALVAAMNADHTASKTRIEKLEASLIAIKAMHHDGGVDDIEERDDRTYFIVCKALEGKDD